MEAPAQAFPKIAPYLNHPLVLIGFVLFLCFMIFRAVIRAKIIPVLSRAAGADIVHRICVDIKDVKDKAKVGRWDFSGRWGPHPG